jgi:Protein of unknown function (DUF3630)
MSYQLKTTQGATEAVIDDNCGISKFYAIANTLKNELEVSFITKDDGAEILDWDFQYKDNFLTLHYSTFNGVSILPLQAKSLKRDHKAVMEVANYLHQRAF